MPLSWNEIKDRSLAFSRKWEEESSEHAEAKSFWDDFFSVFGISRRRVASFEEPVRKLGDKYGYIDLFWKGVLLVEHKSRGKDLDKAYTQALDYFPGITEQELPVHCIGVPMRNPAASSFLRRTRSSALSLVISQSAWASHASSRNF